MTDDTLLHRQVHPHFIVNDKISSQVFSVSIASTVFKPTLKDEGKLSVYNGDKYTAEQSYEHYEYLSAGVVSVSKKECTSEELECTEDNNPFDGHSYINFEGLSNNQIEKKAKKLKSLAVKRGWQYGPNNN